MRKFHEDVAENIEIGITLIYSGHLIPQNELLRPERDHSLLYQKGTTSLKSYSIVAICADIFVWPLGCTF